MSTEHCPDCNPGPLSEWKNNRCGAGHLYVKEFGPGYIDENPELKEMGYKGFLYVGSTGKTVEWRHDENWTNERYTNKPSAKNIKKHCKRDKTTYRYDLITKERFRNPIKMVKGDKNKLKRWEAQLAKHLENRGYHVDQS